MKHYFSHVYASRYRVALWLCIALALCAGLLPVALQAQVTSVTAVTPPGTLGADAATAIGWLRWIFGVLAVALIVVAAMSMTRHPGAGLAAACGVLVCILIAANAQGIVTALYHSGTG